MFTNRPMFDDEDLPDWLKDAGITYAGQTKGQSKPPQASRPNLPSSPTMPPAPQATQPSQSPQAPQTLQPGQPGFGLTGMLPWRKEFDQSEPSGDVPTKLPGTGLLPWLKEVHGEAKPSTGPDAGPLPWQTGAASTDSTTASTAPRSAGTDYLPWRDGPSAGAPPEPQKPYTPAPAELPASTMPWESTASNTAAPIPNTLPSSAMPWETPPSAPLSPPAPAEPSPAPRGMSRFLDTQPPSAPPSKPPAPTSDDDWLDSLRGDAANADFEASSTAGDDWLAEAEIGTSDDTNLFAESAPAGADDWLAGISADITPLAASVPAEMFTPGNDDWLTAFNDNAADTGSVPSSQTEPETAGMAADMLASLNFDDDLFAADTPELGDETPQPVAEPAQDDWLAGFMGDALPAAGNFEEQLSALPAGVEEFPLDMLETESARAFSEAEPAQDDWLAAMMGQKPEAPVPPAPTPTSPEPQVAAPAAKTEDDWLDALSLDFEASEAPEAPAPVIKPLKSLKPTQPPPAPTPVAAVPTEAVDEVPDWFKDAAPVTPSASSAPASASVDEVPDWFRETGAPAAPPPTPSAPPSADWLPPKRVLPAPDLPAEEKSPDPIPDWMTMTNPNLLTRTDAADAEAENLSVADDIPEWMRDMAPAVPQPSQLGAPQVEEENLDWLTDSVQTQTPPASSTSVPSSPMDAFLGDLGFVDTSPAAAAPDSADFDLGKISSLDIDTLLNLPPSGALDQLREAQADAPEETPIQESTAALNLDDLLGPEVELPPPAPATPPPSRMKEQAAQLDRVLPPAPAPIPMEHNPTEIIPEWISDMRPADAPISLKVGDMEVKFEQLPLSQLSDQVRQFRERVKPYQEQKHPQGPVPATGPLAGITDAINLPSDLLKPGISTAVSKIMATDLHVRRVKQLQAIVAAQDEILSKRAGADEDASPEAVAAAQKVKPGRQRAKPKLDRVVVSLLLLAILIAPFFTNVFNIVAIPTRAALSDDAKATFDSATRAIDTLKTGDSTLVAFEYGPTGAGELDDLAKVVLRELFRKQVRVIIVSTNPAGALHAQGLAAQFAQNTDESKFIGRAVAPGKDYIVLRYLPGGAAGVRAVVSALEDPGLQRQIVFGSDLDGKAVGLNDADLTKLRLTPAFVLTETQDDVRNWAEQYRSTGAIQSLKLVLLSSASAAATAQTYTRAAALGGSTTAASSNISGLMVGLRDAMIYQGEKRQYPSATAQTLALQRWQSVGLSALMAATLILVGIVINLLRSLRRRK